VTLINATRLHILTIGFDHCWVPSHSISANENNGVLWEDVVSVEQAKKPDPNLQEEAVLQLSNAVLEIPRHQQRHFIIVYFTDWRSIEFYKYDYDEHEVVFRSGLMQFFHETLNTSKLTDGFLMYIAFRLSSPSILGFQSIIVEIPHKVKNFFDGNEVDLIRFETTY
jgi:hypothetical protein